MQAEVEKICAKLPNTSPEYVIDCDKVATLPDVTIVLANKKFVLHGKDYVLEVTSEASTTSAPLLASTGGYFPVEPGQTSVAAARSVASSARITVQHALTATAPRSLHGACYRTKRSASAASSDSTCPPPWGSYQSFCAVPAACCPS